MEYKMWFHRQNQAISQRETNLDEIMFSTQVEGCRVYSSCPDKDCYARLLLSDVPGSDYCNELLWCDTWAYMDLDSPTGLADLGFTEPEFMAEFNALLIDCFHKHLEVDLVPNNFLWSCSSRPEKMSYHIKVACNHYWPESARKADMKDFFKLVDTECLNRKGFHFLQQDDDQVQIHSILDLSVYSARRCMRSLNCKKTHTPRFVPVGGKCCHSTIVQHMLTVTPSEKKHLEPFVLKTRTQVPRNRMTINTSVLSDLATQYGSTYVKTQGSLVQLRNNGPRVCPLGGETNLEDNAYFILKDQGHSVYYGCHNAACCGKLQKINVTLGPKEFEYYMDYRKLVNKSDVKRSDVEEYIKSCVKLVDRPEEAFFVTLSKIGLECFGHRVFSKQVSCSKALFNRYSDISVIDTSGEEPEVIRFSKVLSDLLKRRQIPTYRDVVWQPYLKNSPHVPSNKYNLFQGFALEDVPSQGIDFEKTQIYDLLHKLCGNNAVHVKYLFSFLAAKLQRPFIKHPICLAFINSREGSGKGSFGEFLKRLFACGENTLVSFNSLTSFANSFNGIQARALFIVLEEVSARKGGLKEWNGLLKDKISSTSLLVERKCKERVQTPWFANVVIFSNEFQVLSCSKFDRRLVFFSSDSSKANNKSYFVKVYTELDSVPHMKAAFDYFSSYDISDFNYRAIPYSRIKEKLAQCSEKHVTKFHRHFLSSLSGQAQYFFTKNEVYSHYRDYVQECGISKQADLHHVCANLELYVKMTLQGEEYVLQDTVRRRYLNEM